MNRSVNPFRWDPIITEYFFGNACGNRYVEPERELMRAILEDAIECYVKYRTSRDGIGTKLFSEANEWFFADDEDQPFSFINICDALNLSPSFIRQGIQKLKYPPPALEQKKKAQQQALFDRISKIAIKEREESLINNRLSKRRRSAIATRRVKLSRTGTMR
jgi:hypothetical protein